MKTTAKKQTGRKPAMTLDEFSVGRNRQLRYAVTRPQKSPVRGTVIYLQDWGVPIENSRNVAAELSGRGFHCISFDWFETGSSAERQSPPAHPMERFRFDPEKLNIFLREVVLPDFPSPLFILAQRAGGLFALNAHKSLLNQIHRMVIISPQMEVRGWSARSLYHHYLRLLIMTGLESGRWHRESAVDWVLGKADNHMIDTNPHWSKSILDSIGRITSPAYYEQMAVPTLFITSNRDTRSDPSATRQFANQLRFAQTVSIPGATPAMLEDKPFYVTQFWAAFDAFIPGTGAPATDRMLEETVIV